MLVSVTFLHKQLCCLVSAHRYSIVSEWEGFHDQQPPEWRLPLSHFYPSFTLPTPIALLLTFLPFFFFCLWYFCLLLVAQLPSPIVWSGADLNAAHYGLWLAAAVSLLPLFHFVAPSYLPLMNVCGNVCTYCNCGV